MESAKVSLGISGKLEGIKVVNRDRLISDANPFFRERIAHSVVQIRMKHVTMGSDIHTKRDNRSSTHNVDEDISTFEVAELANVISYSIALLPTDLVEVGGPSDSGLHRVMVKHVDINDKLSDLANTTINAMNPTTVDQVIDLVGTTPFVEVSDRLNGIIVITFVSPRVARSEGEAIQEITKTRIVGGRRFGQSTNAANKIASRRKSRNVAIDSTQNGKARSWFTANGPNFFGKHFPPDIVVVNLAPTIWSVS